MAVVVPLEVLTLKAALLGDEAAPGHAHCGCGLEWWRGHYSILSIQIQLPLNMILCPVFLKQTAPWMKLQLARQEPHVPPEAVGSTCIFFPRATEKKDRPPSQAPPSPCRSFTASTSAINNQQTLRDYCPTLARRESNKRPHHHHHHHHHPPTPTSPYPLEFDRKSLNTLSHNFRAIAA
jgi:hypothetical protein